MPEQEDDRQWQNGYKNDAGQIGEGEVFRVLLEMEVFDHIHFGFADDHDKDQSAGKLHGQLLGIPFYSNHAGRRSGVAVNLRCWHPT
jgi:hypothetical protein